MKMRYGMAALWLLGMGLAQANPPSFADLAKHAEYSQVKISPDG